MNGLSERYRTLGELRAQLQMRLGFVSSGPGAMNNRDLMNSFLQEGHEFICSEVDVKGMKKRGLIMLEKGSYMYDWENDQIGELIDPGQVLSMWVHVTEANPVELIQGITERHRASGSGQSYPTRWDNTNSQIELWPVPDRAYPLVIWYTSPQARFTRDADRPSVPDRLVLMYALSIGKAHYRHPDAQVYGSMFERMLAKYKADQHENQRYFVRGSPIGAASENVQRVGDGYQLRVG